MRGDLTIGGVQRCETFGRGNYLPCPSQQPEQPEEPQQPQEPQPSDPCNQYTTPETCKDHSLPSENCTWIDNACRTRP